MCFAPTSATLHSLICQHRSATSEGHTALKLIRRGTSQCTLESEHGLYIVCTLEVQATSNNNDLA